MCGVTDSGKQTVLKTLSDLKQISSIQTQEGDGVLATRSSQEITAKVRCQKNRGGESQIGLRV